MALSIGIVGLPNVGKSSLFTTLTKKAVSISNYPFTTIDPNVGVVPVPDVRLKPLAVISRSSKVTPAVVEFVDIAGLVRGANKGEGLGNQFLANIREVDAVAEVVRAFSDPDIMHVEGQPDPIRDHSTVETELILKDFETVEKRLESAEKESKTGGKEAIAAAQTLLQMKEALAQGRPLRDFAEDEAFVQQARLLGLLTAKPLLVLVNVNDPKEGVRIVEEFAQRGMRAFMLNAKEELEAAGFTQDERDELGAGLQPLDQCIAQAYDLLGLISFLTTGEKETRARTIRKGTKALQAAGAIHSDFEKKFIRADVIAWEKFIEVGGWAGARAKGLVRSEGKDYVVQEGDVLDIKHG